MKNTRGAYRSLPKIPPPPTGRSLAITIPRELADPMDRQIAQTGMSRSAYFIRLIEHELSAKVLVEREGADK